MIIAIKCNYNADYLISLTRFFLLCVYGSLLDDFLFYIHNGACATADDENIQSRVFFCVVVFVWNLFKRTFFVVNE